MDSESAQPLENITQLLWFVAAVMVGLAAAMAVRVTWVGIRRSRERRVAARASPQDQLKWRGDFMRTLIEMAGRDTSPSKRLRALRRRLGWTEGHALLVLDYLAGKGLVRRSNWMATEQEPFMTLGRWFGGIRVGFTGSGLDEAERAEGGPTEHLPHIVAQNSIVTVNSEGAAIHSPGAHSPGSATQSPGSAIHSPGSAIQSPGSTQTLIENGLDPRLLAEWIEMYRDALENPGLSASAVLRVQRRLEQLEDAIDDGDPTSVMRHGRALRAIAEGVAGNAVFAAIVAAAGNLPFGQ